MVQRIPCIWDLKDSFFLILASGRTELLLTIAHCYYGFVLRVRWLVFVAYKHGPYSCPQLPKSVGLHARHFILLYPYLKSFPLFFLFLLLVDIHLLHFSNLANHFVKKKVNKYCYLRERGYYPKASEEEPDLSYNNLVKMRKDFCLVSHNDSKRKS